MIYKNLTVTPNTIQQAAINNEQFDIAIHLLEAAIVDGRKTVRSALAEILTPSSSTPDATATHEALLLLAENREGRIRLITTNFDLLFEKVKTSKSLSFKSFNAPLLPVPKARWDGLVYLHGLLPNEPTESDLDQLILSSGDFGRAYLIERWAARFVSELFRNFSVCFVGYSINDPVLRYMTDAIAAEGLLGEKPLEMFAFGGYADGEEVECKNGWEAKNVTPILYREDEYHTHLHNTLGVWAKAYRDGVRSKEQIVVECAIANPITSTKHNNIIGRMLWALNDPSGLPAKRFAELDPVPSLDWLEPLSQQYLFSPRMAIVDDGDHSSKLDVVTIQLIRWLIRHLDDPKLLVRLVNRGGQLHDFFRQKLKQRLGELDRLISTKNATELDRIRENAPNAIPRPEMRTLWYLMIDGHIKPKKGNNDLSLYSWINQFERDGLTTGMRLSLRKILTPLLSLSDSCLRNDDKNDLGNWDVVLASTHHAHDALVQLSENMKWKEALPALLNDFNTLLRDLFDLRRELGAVNDKEDDSYWHQPSISEHPQNEYHNYKDWTILIKLTREAWIELAKRSPERARIYAEAWMHVPYPVFKRFSFFAAAHEGVISHRQALDWLLSDERWWFWSNETKRETIRLLVFLAPQLDVTMMAELEQAILSELPRDMHCTDISTDDSHKAIEHSVFLRLAKVAQTGVALSEVGERRLKEIEMKYGWLLAPDERDEFPGWMSSGSGLFQPKNFTPLPRRRRGVLDYLLAHPVLDESQGDDWRRRCSESFQATAYALYKLAKTNNWPVNRWRDALQAWAEEKLSDCSWRFMASVVVEAPNDFLQSLSHGVSRWLEVAAKTFEGDDSFFLKLAQRILQLDFDHNGEIDDYISHAINHPIGHITFALIYRWLRQKPNDGQGLPEDVKSIFTELCDIKIAKFRSARVLLSAHVISLFRTDKAWSAQYLLPLYKWNSLSDEAKSVWQGFLWSLQLYRPFIEAIKSDFLDMANYYIQLADYHHQFARLLTFATLELRDILALPQIRGHFNQVSLD
ncbi:hypothetical protein Lgee_0532 [Legionella geestiana]|uniref:Uncharacterized protein n=2 Tax=Legionella geestiana TaxID=45065 RepID=A0A0W0U7X4_9GAMM|nr:hypothetical protein Lgee_0532 [Legionella geestiana]STX53821.1 Uncharacterised protein [Legionella geestiana]